MVAQRVVACLLPEVIGEWEHESAYRCLTDIQSNKMEVMTNCYAVGEAKCWAKSQAGSESFTISAVVRRFFWPPLIPRSIASPVTVSAQICRSQNKYIATH